MIDHCSACCRLIWQSLIRISIHLVLFVVTILMRNFFILIKKKKLGLNTFKCVALQ